MTEAVQEAIRRRVGEVSREVELMVARRAGLLEALELAGGEMDVEVLPVADVATRQETPSSPALPAPRKRSKKRKRAPKKKAPSPARPPTRTSKAKAPTVPASGIEGTAKLVLGVFEADPEQTYTVPQVHRQIGDQRAGTPQNVRNHVSRLVERGLVDKVDIGLFQLAGGAR